MARYTQYVKGMTTQEKIDAFKARIEIMRASTTQAKVEDFKKRILVRLLETDLAGGSCLNQKGYSMAQLRTVLTQH